MVEEFKDRKEHLILRRDRQVEEYQFMNNIVALNTMMHENKTNPAAVIAVEREIAALDFENIAASFPLDHWRIQFGENMIVPILCDVVNYFLRQFEVKEMLTDLQIVQLVSKLLVAQPKLRIMELVFVLKEALNGTYGPTYQRIGIDTLLGWLGKFYESSAVHLETKRINTKPEESRGDAPWTVIEKQMKQYETEQREKKAIVDKVWQKESHNRKVEDYKKETLSTDKNKAA